MRGSKQITAVVAGILLSASAAIGAASTDTTQPTQNAFDLYNQAAQLIKVDSPSSSYFSFPSYPPYNEQWISLAKDAWEKNGPARDLVRQASAIDQVTWLTDKGRKYLNQLRSLANEVGDAALYAHLQGNHAEAIAGIRDLLHMVDLLETNPPHNNNSAIHLLVGDGIQATAANRLMIIDSGIVLTADPKDARDVWIVDARELVQQLLDQPDLKDQITEIISPKGSLGQIKLRQSANRFIEITNRSNTERNFAAMSLACHIFRFEKNRWPKSIEELVPDYLPSLPIDPWGDGKQTLVYVLITGGLPDGSDRPLLFSRCNVKEGLVKDGFFYRLDGPEYGYYTGDGTSRSPKLQKQGGQFRDVARWAPPAGGVTGPTTRAYALSASQP